MIYNLRFTIQKLSSAIHIVICELLFDNLDIVLYLSKPDNHHNLHFTRENVRFSRFFFLYFPSFSSLFSLSQYFLNLNIYEENFRLGIKKTSNYPDCILENLKSILDNLFGVIIYIFLYFMIYFNIQLEIGV